MTKKFILKQFLNCIQFSHLLTMNNYLHMNYVLAYFFIKNEILAAFDATGCKPSSMFFSTDQYFDFIIVNVANEVLHRYMMQMVEVCVGLFQKFLELLLWSKVKIQLDFLKKKCNSSQQLKKITKFIETVLHVFMTVSNVH